MQNTQIHQKIAKVEQKGRNHQRPKFYPQKLTLYGPHHGSNFLKRKIASFGSSTRLNQPRIKRNRFKKKKKSNEETAAEAQKLYGLRNYHHQIRVVHDILFNPIIADRFNEKSSIKKSSKHKKDKDEGRFRIRGAYKEGRRFGIYIQ